MDAEVLVSLVGEIAPRVVGMRVEDVSSPAPDLVVFRIDGDAPMLLGVNAGKALPLLFLAAEEAPPDLGRESDVPRALKELKGSTISALTVAPGTVTAVLALRKRDQLGSVREREVLMNLGKAPSVSVSAAPRARTGAERDASGAPPAAARVARRAPSPAGTDVNRDATREPHPTGPSGPAAVASRHDDAGRLHVGIPPGDRHWDERRTFASWNAAAVHAATRLLPEIVIERRRSELRRAVGRRLRRKRRALDKVEREIADSARAEEYRYKAQLLLTRKSEIPRGKRRVSVLDYDNSTTVEIEVDPSLPPSRNAEALFARARKAERRAQRAPARREEIVREIEALENTLSAIGGATPTRLSELEVELGPPARKSSRRTDGERARFRTYTVSGGWEVLVGKTNRDNDILTHKIARPGDLWFHARQSPGSHVILRTTGRRSRPGQQAILEAAAIAAFHSKARGAASVPVSYTERRYVRKPRGSKPGLAVVKNEKVIFVAPALPGT